MSGWPVVALGDVAEVIAGQSPKGEFYNKIGVGTPFYQGKKDFGPRFVEPTSVWTSVSTRIALPGDILMSVRAPVGPVNLAVEECCIGRGLAAIRTFGLIDRDFLFYYFRSKRGSFAGTEGAVFDSINKAQIQQIEIPLPPLDEQKRIVAKLDQVHSEVWNLTSHLDGQREATRSLEKSFLKDRLGLRGLSSGQFGLNDSEPSPKWQERPLASLCKIQTGKRDANEGDPEGQYHFFTCARDHSFIDTYKFDTEALLIAGNGDVGAVKYFSGKFDAYQRTYVLTDFKGVLPRFLFRVLNGLLRDQLVPQKLGNTMPYIRVGMLENFSVPLPSIAEQESLLAELEGFAMAREKLEATHSKQLSLVSAFQAATLSAALVGDI